MPFSRNLNYVSTYRLPSHKVTEEGRHVEGVYVHYRPRRILHLSSSASVKSVVDSLSSSVISHDLFSGHLMHGQNFNSFHPHNNDSATNSYLDLESSPWSTVTVMNAFASSYVLSRLSPNTEYEVFLAPFSNTETGQPTALLTNITFETGKLILLSAQLNVFHEPPCNTTYHHVLLSNTTYPSVLLDSAIRPTQSSDSAALEHHVCPHLLETSRPNSCQRTSNVLLRECLCYFSFNNTIIIFTFYKSTTYVQSLYEMR